VGDHLRCDLAELERAARALDALGREFSQAADLSDDASTAVGHGGLAGKLQHFSDGWRVRREDLLEDMTHLAELTHTAVTTYRDVDSQLAAAATR
jgi:hypothetical protein